jgi:hypothetical protein
MITEKRRGMATRANDSGSLVSSFNSPIYIPPPVSVPIPLFFISFSAGGKEQEHFGKLYHKILQYRTT